MKNNINKYTDNIVHLQNRIEKARQDMEFANELIAQTTDEQKKQELIDKNAVREQDIHNMRAEILGAINSRARDSR